MVVFPFPFHIVVPVGNLWYIRLQRQFPILRTSGHDLYPFIRPLRKPLALDRGINSVPSYVRRPLSTLSNQELNKYAKTFQLQAFCLHLFLPSSGTIIENNVLSQILIKRTMEFLFIIVFFECTLQKSSKILKTFIFFILVRLTNMTFTRFL